MLTQPLETQQFDLYHPMAPLPRFDAMPFQPHAYSGLHLGSLLSTACFSTRTCLIPVPAFRLAQAIFEPNLSHTNTPTISSWLFFLLTLPMKMGQTERFETSAYKIHMPGNHPKERIWQRILCITRTVKHNYNSSISTVRIQLHVSALYVGHLQVEIF